MVAQRIFFLSCLCGVLLACQPATTPSVEQTQEKDADALVPAPSPSPNASSQQQGQVSLDAIRVITGELQYVPLEGGFYTILTTRGEQFTLSRLPQEFQRPGLIVAITGRPLPDAMTITQHGTLFEVRNVQVIDDSKAKSNYAEQ